MRKIILLVFVVMIGACTALANQNKKTNNNNLRLKADYFFSTVTNSCQPIRICSNLDGEACTINDMLNDTTVYGLNVPGNFSSCNKKLFSSNQ
ncbi:hypothetical protein [Elizabethkingia anophelis]|uniref:hypothetical protein n=1 Tax=Elizabethkingia anophelis TaxID=1117645 RepID=UPI00111D18D3|nr:hypothetical protein [Elizabethkingia anophelis]